MSSVEQDDSGLLGRPVIDIAGVAVGHVAGLYWDAEALRPAWVAVTVDARQATVLVPIEVASVNAAGQIALPYAQAVLATAPAPEAQVLTTEQTARLRDHYGLIT